MPSPRRDDLAGLARVLLAAVIWGTIPLVLRFVDGASTVKVFYRVAFGLVAMLTYLAVRGRLGEIRRLPRRKSLTIAAQGALLALNWILFISALDRTTVATAELLGYTGPVFVAAFAPMVTKEPFDRRIVAPLLLSLGGIVVILAPQGLRVSSTSEMLGAALAFGSALTYSMLMLNSKRMLTGVSAGTLLLGEYITASALLLPSVFLLPGPTNPGSFAALAVLGVVQTAFAVLLFLSGLRRVRTDHAAVITYAEPVSAVLLAAAFLGEPLTWSTLLGGAMVVGGGAIVARLSPTFGPETADAASGVEPEDGPAPGADALEGAGDV